MGCDLWDVGGREGEEESGMTSRFPVWVSVDGSARFSVEADELHFGHVGSDLPGRPYNRDIEQGDEMRGLQINVWEPLAYRWQLKPWADAWPGISAG